MDLTSSKILRWFFALIFLSIFIAILIGSLFTYQTRSAKAELAVFFPTTCLGGWKETQNAVGLPDVYGVDVDLFNETNSAYVNGPASQIFCGGFKGEIPEDALHKKVFLKLSWAKEGEFVSTDSEEENVGNTEDTENTAENTEEDITDEPTEDISEEENESIDTTDEDVVEEEIFTEPNVIEESPAIETGPVTEEVSILNRFFFDIANAEEVEEVEEMSDVLSDPLSEINLELSPLLEIKYTLDGDTWSSLGFVYNISSDTYFEMPENVLNNISDLEKVQISINTLYDFEGQQKILIDSMWFEVEYNVNNNSNYVDQVANVIFSNDHSDTPIDESPGDYIEEEDPEEDIDTDENPSSPPSPTKEEIDRMPKLNINADNRFTIDFNAKHHCTIEPFVIDLNSEIGDIYIKISSDGTYGYELNIGTLPMGIDMLFEDSESKDMVSDVQNGEYKLSIIKYDDAQEGNFSVPVFMTLDSEIPSTTACNLNIINI